MPIHYRSLTRQYREVALEGLRKAVERIEIMLSQFRLEEIEWNDFMVGWREHVREWEWVSAPEVLAQDPVIANDAQDVVNRNEVLLKYVGLIDLAAKFEKRCPHVRQGKTREEFLGWHHQNSCLENVLPPYPPLVPTPGVGK